MQLRQMQIFTWACAEFLYWSQYEKEHSAGRDGRGSISKISPSPFIPNIAFADLWKRWKQSKNYLISFLDNMNICLGIRNGDALSIKFVFYGTCYIPVNIPVITGIYPGAADKID